MYEKLQSYFLPKRQQEMLNDVEYLLVEHNYASDQTELKQQAQKAKDTVYKHALVGALGGVSLSLSLRRYFPTVFGSISMNRIAAESILVVGLSLIGLKLGLENISHDMRNLKYKLTMSHDPSYMTHLRAKARQFNYKSEYNLLRDILNNREYLEWKENAVGSLIEQLY